MFWLVTCGALLSSLHQSYSLYQQERRDAKVHWEAEQDLFAIESLGIEAPDDLYDFELCLDINRSAQEVR